MSFSGCVYWKTPSHSTPSYTQRSSNNCPLSPDWLAGGRETGKHAVLRLMIGLSTFPYGEVQYCTGTISWTRIVPWRFSGVCECVCAEQGEELGDDKNLEINQSQLETETKHSSIYLISFSGCWVDQGIILGFWGPWRMMKFSLKFLLWECWDFLEGMVVLKLLGFQ